MCRTEAFHYDTLVTKHCVLLSTSTLVDYFNVKAKFLTMFFVLFSIWLLFSLCVVFLTKAACSYC